MTGKVENVIAGRTNNSWVVIQMQIVSRPVNVLIRINRRPIARARVLTDSRPAEEIEKCKMAN